jgi:Dolichyl-phosphate-mannose-protein mannosyltransferase
MSFQDIIHYLEVGAGKRYLRFLLPCIVILTVAVLYDFRAWKNFSAPEAMDSAQLARNIADGKGYTTQFIRPLSLYLVQAKNETKQVSSSSPDLPDYARVKTAHPDLANPPIYPLVLAGLMKIFHFHYAVDLKSVFWANNGFFARYQPDFIIGIFNELLFFAAAVATYFIARKLFDARVAWLTMVLMLGCNLLWRFSASGLSTMLLLLMFLGLIRCVLAVEERGRDPEPDTFRILCWSAAAGILIGIGALTRYSFGWMIIPAGLFLLLFSGPQKPVNALVAIAAFVVVLAPWVVRNVALSGVPFGTASYSIFDGTPLALGLPMDRSLHPILVEALSPGVYWHKFMLDVRPILESDLLQLGGSWVSVLFLTGLLLAFNRLSVRRMRYFLLMCLATFIVVQALGRTTLSDIAPEINSENLLVLTAPLVIIFGTALFFIFLDQMKLPATELRYVVIGIFITLCCLPLFFAIWFKTSPVAYPPNYPPDIEKQVAWIKPNELIMSDVPWAVAWYGQRQCVWLTIDSQDEFFSLNDYIKPVNALYLTLQTMDGRLVTDCFRSGKASWGHFAMDATTRNQIPTNFPLHHSPSGLAALSSGLFLTDAERWRIGTNSGQ